MKQKAVEALVFGTDSGRKLLTLGIFSVFTYSVMVLLSFPGYSYQMAATSFFLVPEAVYELSWNLTATAGYTGLFLTLLYSLLGGLAFNLLLYSPQGLAGAGGLAPGVLVSGCASCGAGVLTMLGLSGAVALMPFEGNLLRVAGILIIGFVLARVGDPRVCEV